MKELINWKTILGAAVLLILVFVAAQSISNWFFVKGLEKASNKMKSEARSEQEAENNVAVQQKFS